MEVALREVTIEINNDFYMNRMVQIKRNFNINTVVPQLSVIEVAVTI